MALSALLVACILFVFFNSSASTVGIKPGAVILSFFLSFLLPLPPLLLFPPLPDLPFLLELELELSSSSSLFLLLLPDLPLPLPDLPPLLPLPLPFKYLLIAFVSSSPNLSLLSFNQSLKLSLPPRADIASFKALLSFLLLELKPFFRLDLND